MERNSLRAEIPLKACFVRLHRLSPHVTSSESTCQTLSSLINTFKSRLRKVEDPDLFFTHVNEDDFITTQIEHARRVINRNVPATPSTQSLSSITSRKSEKKKRPFWSKSIDVGHKQGSVRKSRSTRSSMSRKKRGSTRKKRKTFEPNSRFERKRSEESDFMGDHHHQSRSRGSTRDGKEKPLFKKIIPLTKRPETRKRMALDLEISNATTKRSIPLRVFVHPDDSHTINFDEIFNSPLPSVRGSSHRPSTSSGRRRGVDMSDEDDMVNIGTPTGRSSVSAITTTSHRSMRQSSRRTPSTRTTSRKSSTRPKSSRGSRVMNIMKRNNNTNKSSRPSSVRSSRNHQQQIRRPQSLTLEDLADDDDMLSTDNLQPYFNVEVGRRNNNNMNNNESLLMESSSVVQKLQRALVQEQEKNRTLSLNLSKSVSSSRVRKSTKKKRNNRRGRKR